LNAGDFSTRNLPLGYSATPGVTKYLLGVGALTNTWIALTGDWENGANWSLSHAPIASEDVVIPDVGGSGVTDTIRVNSAGQAVHSFTNAEELKIFTGAGLTFSQASTSTGTITIAGGTLTANANLSTNTLNLSSGTLNGG